MEDVRLVMEQAAEAVAAEITHHRAALALRIVLYGLPDIARGAARSDGWTAVTRDRSLSAQYEHSVGVTETGVEVFTLSPRGLDRPGL